MEDAASFAPDPAPPFVQEFINEYWGTSYAEIADPDGRTVALEGPPIEGLEPRKSANHGKVQLENSSAIFFMSGIPLDRHCPIIYLWKCSI